MIDIIVIKDESGKIVFSKANVVDELVINVFFKL